MKNLSVILLLSGILILSSCQENAGSKTKKDTDSVQSGLEGTREDASQLSNATIDTSAGKTVKKANLKDSSKMTKDSAR